MWLWFRLEGNTAWPPRLPLADLRPYRRHFFTNLHFANALFTSSSPEVGSTSGWKTGMSNTRRWIRTETHLCTEAAEFLRPTQTAVEKRFGTRRPGCHRAASKGILYAHHFFIKLDFAAKWGGGVPLLHYSTMTASQSVSHVLSAVGQPPASPHTLGRETVKLTAEADTAKDATKHKKALKRLLSGQTFWGTEIIKAFSQEKKQEILNALLTDPQMKPDCPLLTGQSPSG